MAYSSEICVGNSDNAVTDLAGGARRQPGSRLKPLRDGFDFVLDAEIVPVGYESEQEKQPRQAHPWHSHRRFALHGGGERYKACCTDKNGGHDLRADVCRPSMSRVSEIAATSVPAKSQATTRHGIVFLSLNNMAVPQ
jgi:hypothetical protein